MSKAVTPTAEAPGGGPTPRRDAEADLALVLSFLNTTDAEEHTDVLDHTEQWRRWCEERGLAQARDLDAVRDVRDSLRASVTHSAEDEPRLPASTLWPLHVTLETGVPTLSATDALGAVLAAAVHLVATDHWDRLKICPADDCLWAFYDRSRNRSRTWCSMQVCGNRKKARSWRERHTTS
ncbi:CGNR zinc finger domain-containing protein [Allosaccharopolyspora coralli]|uniref:CGNR zinc finger domain-containing protein n=1 Tax=Allosaccharopolyspora coralli TaxID=2665642 RepID=UPI001E370E05|nr:CGNR zinc finger domain-containing protein [Allosaccharopolyspora coralli]